MPLHVSDRHSLRICSVRPAGSDDIKDYEAIGDVVNQGGALGASGAHRRTRVHREVASAYPGVLAESLVLRGG